MLILGVHDHYSVLQLQINTLLPATNGCLSVTEAPSAGGREDISLNGQKHIYLTASTQSPFLLWVVALLDVKVKEPG